MALINRRRFLTGASALSLGSSLGLLGALTQVQAAEAADVSGYKALVCIFLLGGMDHGDTVLPYDFASHDALRGLRSGIFGGHDGKASSRERSNLLALNPSNAATFDGRAFALPQELAPLHTLFEAGEAAIVGSVGTLVEPTTRTAIDRDAVRLPGRLFSHNDQQTTWMSMGVEGAGSGWGGRFAEAILRANPSDNPIFATMTASGNDVFLSSANTRQFRLSAKGLPVTEAIERSAVFGNGTERDEVRARLKAYLSGAAGTPENLYMQDYAASNARWFENVDAFRAATSGAAGLSTAFPDTALGGKMKAIAETIAVRSSLNMNRQIFYATVGGFDTHSNQVDELPALHAEIAGAVAAFRTAMQEVSAWNDVTVFTGSDFGRSIIGNGDGTDHGWGGHHFVAGGSVVGKTIYGDMTGFDINGANAEQYVSRRGILIPQVSVDQYAATLGSWFGLDAAELVGALPNLANFDQKDLGFLGGS